MEPTKIATTRILKSTRDWHAWYGSVVTQATQLRVWEYIDPESDKELEKPTRPARPRNNAELTSTAQLILKMDLEQYREDYATWTRADTNIASMRTFICNSVDSIHISDLAATIVSPRELLKKLKARLCPSDRTRATELLNRYESLKRSPKTQDLEKWIYEWMEVVRDGKGMKKIEEEGAKLHFYRANAKINEALTDSITLWEETVENVTFEDIANKFLSKYREKGVTSKSISGSRYAFASSTSETSEKPDPEKSQREKTCLCGKHHAWKNCFYIVPSIRPRNWKEDENIQKKVDGIIAKNPRVRNVVTRIRKTAEDKKDKSVSASSSSKKSANYTVEQEQNLDSEDEFVQESFATFALQHSSSATNNESTSSIYPLKQSFIIDPASSLHICNMRDRFISLTPCNDQSLLTGDSKTMIEGFGDIWVKFTKADGTRRKVKLQNAAFIPRFHTNLISTAKLREDFGVCLNERVTELQFIDTGACAAKLNLVNKMFVAEYNQISNIALATGSNLPSPISDKNSTKSAVLKPATGTQQIWSERLGHPSEQAIAQLPQISNVQISDLDRAKKRLELVEARELAVANQQISKAKTVYCEFAKGFEQEKEKCLLLKRALYGLRRSPILWQNELSKTLSKIGLVQVPEEPCLFRTEDSTKMTFIFFYVDDIVILSKDKKERDRIKSELMGVYEMRDVGELKWFLNINITRDRNQRRIWLSQELYINKIIKTYNLEHAPKANTPLSIQRRDLVKHDGTATKQETHSYQRRIGSTIYPAVITRPDIACATSLLAQFLQNPSPRHRAEADRLICYLRDSKNLAIRYDGNIEDDVVEAASDAAYGDDRETRRSSEGWVLKLFGGPIDWKATRQTTVTTSTTEAELLALSHAATALIWWKRFFGQLGLSDIIDKGPLKIKCDNIQTVGHVMDDKPKLRTQLQHVDIRNHWLREKVAEKELEIKWVPTAEMLADGMTKPLELAKHKKFVEQLGLERMEK